MTKTTSKTPYDYEDAYAELGIPKSHTREREMVKERIDAFRDCPCEAHAKALEDIGFSVDFKTEDHGN